MSRGGTAWIALAAGVALLCASGWIHVKAALAQLLLEHAWRSARAGQPAPPWPWADTLPLARLRAPAQGVELIVLAGATGRSLAFGPGHVDGSARPGSPGNVVLVGHRDTHFRFLRELSSRDLLVLEGADGRRRRYAVEDTRVTDASDASPLDPAGPARLTLITCWPFDAPVPGGPLRYVVTARAIE
jgi:sortase A